MSRRPTPEQQALLGPIERINLRIAELAHTPLTRRLPGLWADGLPGGLIWLGGGRRLRLFGIDELNRRFDERSSVILVANHRSFFDFYIVNAVLHWHTRLSKRALFPVRAEFFYDHPLGGVINAAMSGLSMFPPVVRDPKRAAFNHYSVDRCVEELQVPGTVLGLHPEGTRNKGPDPYSYLKAQPGIGRIVLRAAVPVVPIFILGMSSSVLQEVRLNLTEPEQHPIDVLFGDPIDLDDLRAQGIRATTSKRAADRCLEAIAALGERHRRELAGRG